MSSVHATCVQDSDAAVDPPARIYRNITGAAEHPCFSPSPAWAGPTRCARRSYEPVSSRGCMFSPNAPAHRVGAWRPVPPNDGSSRTPGQNIFEQHEFRDRPPRFSMKKRIAVTSSAQAYVLLKPMCAGAGMWSHRPSTMKQHRDHNFADAFNIDIGRSWKRWGRRSSTRAGRDSGPIYHVGYYCRRVARQVRYALIERKRPRPVGLFRCKRHLWNNAIFATSFVPLHGKASLVDNLDAGSCVGG